MKQKYLLTFSDSGVQNSVSYVLVSEFNIAPSVLHAKIGENGGFMVLSMEGNNADVKAAIERLKGMNIKVRKMADQITLDRNKCIDCGSCISICPTHALHFENTWEMKLDPMLCIGCASCITACPTHAVKLTLPC